MLNNIFKLLLNKARRKKAAEFIRSNATFEITWERICSKLEIDQP